MQEKRQTTLLRMVLVAILHLGVGMAIVVISSFVNAEMKFGNWSSYQISLYLGFPVLFELVRLFFAHLYDQRGYLQRSLVLGLGLSLLGIWMIPLTITPVGNPLIILAISLFYFGSSILTTLVDANLTKASKGDERSRIAGVIQVLRLLGFATGGIVGSLLYSRIPFDLFITLLGTAYLVTGGISLTTLLPTEVVPQESESFGQGVRTLVGLITSGMPLLMTIFLVLYPLGLFMQDLILEPFAIDVFGFERENVGQIVAIWTTLTLVFVPMGVLLDHKISRIIPILSGQFMSMLGLILIAASSFVTSIVLFIFGVVFFGIGNGIASAPAIGMMLDVCAAHPKHLALLLGFFGIMNTLGRFLAASFGGFILFLTADNYIALFLIEAAFVVLATIPLIPLDRQLREVDIVKDVLDPIQTSSIELS